MTGPLDRIEARELFFDDEEGWILVTKDERDALVAVARAARDVLATYDNPEWGEGHPYALLRAALARLEEPM